MMMLISKHEYEYVCKCEYECCSRSTTSTSIPAVNEHIRKSDEFFFTGTAQKFDDDAEKFKAA